MSTELTFIKTQSSLAPSFEHAGGPSYILEITISRPSYHRLRSKAQRDSFVSHINLARMRLLTIGDGRGCGNQSWNVKSRIAATIVRRSSLDTLTFYQCGNKVRSMEIFHASGKLFNRSFDIICRDDSPSDSVDLIRYDSPFVNLWSRTLQRRNTSALPGFPKAVLEAAALPSSNRFAKQACSPHQLRSQCRDTINPLSYKSPMLVVNVSPRGQ